MEQVSSYSSSIEEKISRFFEVLPVWHKWCLIVGNYLAERWPHMVNLMQDGESVADCFFDIVQVIPLVSEILMMSNPIACLKELSVLQPDEMPVALRAARYVFRGFQNVWTKMMPTHIRFEGVSGDMFTALYANKLQIHRTVHFVKMHGDKLVRCQSMTDAVLYVERFKDAFVVRRLVRYCMETLSALGAMRASVNWARVSYHRVDGFRFEFLVSDSGERGTETVSQSCALLFVCAR